MATTTPPAGESEAPRRTLRVVGEERPPGAEAIPAAPQAAVEIWRVSPAGAARERDALAVEEPLEIRLRAGGEERTVALTMRTPGHDAELAAGFLFAEGIVRGRGDLAGVEHRPGGEGAANDPGNVVVAELAAAALPDLAPLERHFFATSACGVCGRAGLEALALRGAAAPPGPVVPAAVLSSLPEALRAAQGVFEATGGLHAAALFDPDGRLIAAREDVGRHNALDKLVGRALFAGELPFAGRILMVSGRASFEILQKALAAGAPFVCAVSAPSSLAVDVARRFGITLVGFLRGDRFNVYAGAERVAGLASGV
jgi:FdhD protein